MSVTPIGIQAITPELLLERVVKEKPKALIITFQREDGQIRFFNSAMPIELRSYLVQVALAVCQNQITSTMYQGNPVKDPDPAC